MANLFACLSYSISLFHDFLGFNILEHTFGKLIGISKLKILSVLYSHDNIVPLNILLIQFDNSFQEP